MSETNAALGIRVEGATCRTCPWQTPHNEKQALIVCIAGPQPVTKNKTDVCFLHPVHQLALARWMENGTRETTENEGLRKERDELRAQLADHPTGLKVPFNAERHKDSKPRLCWFTGAKYGVLGHLCLAWWCKPDKCWKPKGWIMAGWTESNNPTHVADLRDVAVQPETPCEALPSSDFAMPRVVGHEERVGEADRRHADYVYDVKKARRCNISLPTRRVTNGTRADRKKL